MRRRWFLSVLLFLLATGFFGWQYWLPHSAEKSPWTEQEKQQLLSLSLKRLPAIPSDPSNRFATNTNAAALGHELFFDKHLSRNGQVACAACHQPERFFTDGKTAAEALGKGSRNTPSLLGAAHNNWFFWDGRKDSLWSQALGPLENPLEHGLTRTQTVKLLLENPDYLQRYTRLFGSPGVQNLLQLPSEATPEGSLEQVLAWKHMPLAQREAIDQVFANIGKAIAAYVSTLRPLPNRLDTYLQALQKDAQANVPLNDAEIAGARLFIGKAQCILCHSGPLLTNQGFHKIGTGSPGDSGRAAALDKLRYDRFNCLGKYSDAPKNGDTCHKLQFMQRSRHNLLGAFKVPSLRNVSHTAPYMHDGRFDTLDEVVEFYLQTTADSRQDTDLPVIKLTDTEKAELLAFLRTL